MPSKLNFIKLIIVILALSCFSSKAFSHAAIVWACVENNQVVVEAFFANDTKIQNTTVIVVDEKGEQILEGKTDKEGKFSYTPTTKKTQTVVVVAGESHIGDFELSEEDLKEIILPAGNSNNQK